MQSAFVSAPLPVARPSAAVARRVSVARPAMAMPKPAALMGAAAAALAALPAQVLAAEGTGAAFGVEEPALFIPLVAVPVIFGILFIGFAKEQDNEEFFGDYDQRRK